MQFNDTYKAKGLRKHLVEILKKDERIKNELIFEAFENVPRHFFLDNIFIDQAYSNTAFQIGAGQTISHPITVAFQTQLLELKAGDKVLEIGTGSGFQTAILFEMGVNVFSIERQRELYLKTRPLIENLIKYLKDEKMKVLQELKIKVNSNTSLNTIEKRDEISKIEKKYKYQNFSPKMYLGDGYLGSPQNAPFDKIIVTCGAPEVPKALIDQLKPNGYLVIPVGEGKEQIMHRILKNVDGSLIHEEYGTFKFVPMLENLAK